MTYTLNGTRNGACIGPAEAHCWMWGNWKHTFLSILLMAVIPVSLLSSPQETLESLVDQNRVLAEPAELHLTSPGAPMVNSTVSLDHEDAWLFFDNIKPSEVISKHLSGVLVNGAQLVNGSNGRVAIYGHGTVIMPHGASFAPLTVYSGDAFAGTSRQLELHIYHNSLGEFDNAIRSFRLKRGYMATFANNADGSGYSRVFIADQEDLEFSAMPAELYGTVSFVRVFRHEFVSKKAKAGWNPHDLDCTSYYDWNVGGNSSSDVEYVLIRQHAEWPSWSDINAKRNVSHLLGFNEPDRPDQANMTFQQMIDIWPAMMNSGLRIGAPAWSNAWGGDGGNLFDFINTCDALNYRVDFVPLHCYWGGKSPISWYNDLKYIHEQTGRPLWITEWNNGANWTDEWWPDGDRTYTDANALKQLNDIKGILQVLDTASFVERYFIYDWVQDCRAMILNGGLTLAGEYYKENESQIAYNSANEVIPHWNYLEPELSLRYLTLSNSMRLSWTDSNGELTAGYTLEKRVNDGAFETVYTGDDIAVNYYLDPLDAGAGGTVSYRLRLQTKEGEYLVSNEVSYFQTGGTGNVQTGTFRVSNAEWNTTLFSETYTEYPLVVLGIPTFNNVFPMTRRVSNISGSRFKFHIEPWTYLKDPVFTGTDNIAVIALPAGAYDFGGLKAEAMEITNVHDDWLSVQYEQPFTGVPVIFCSIVSGANTSPLTVAVQNVSNTGFELLLKAEEAYTGLVFPETVHVLAIEQGQGDIEGKRITVGRTVDGSGVTSKPVELSCDSSYTQPAFFAGLQTAADDFAATIRYNHTGDHTVNLLKQREFSGGIATVKEDQLGWMVMDMAAGQVIGTHVSTSVRQLKLYPNPAGDVLFIDLDRPTRFGIYDVTGHQLIGAETVHAIDVSALPAGMYILKTTGNQPARFIKK